MKCGFLVWTWRGLHHGRPARELAFAVVGVGCGETGPEMKHSCLTLGPDCLQMIVCLLKIIGKPALAF